MKQPRVYNDEDQSKLINDIYFNLISQKSIGIAENDLVLNIGHAENVELIKYYKYNELIKTKINFEFNFKQILEDVLRLENKKPKYDEKKNIICPYKVNATAVTFSGEAYFSDTTFSGEAYFSDTTFSGVANFYRSTFSGEITFYNIQFKEN